MDTSAYLTPAGGGGEALEQRENVIPRARLDTAAVLILSGKAANRHETEA